MAEGALGKRNSHSGSLHYLRMHRRAWDCVCKTQPSNTLETDLPCSLHEEPRKPPPLSVRTVHSEFLHSLAPGGSHGTDPEQSLFPPKHPRGTRSWRRTMEKPEIHGGEAQALVSDASVPVETKGLTQAGPAPPICSQGCQAQLPIQGS